MGVVAGEPGAGLTLRFGDFAAGHLIGDVGAAILGFLGTGERGEVEPLMGADQVHRATAGSGRIGNAEIEQGIVEIKAIAREAGHRSKIAVISHHKDVSAKGACIGPMGQRVRSVMHELNEEKIDIVDWSDDPARFIASALSPAKVSSVQIVDAQARAARIIVAWLR